jgi:hypothetical protein
MLTRIKKDVQAIDYIEVFDSLGVRVTGLTNSSFATKFATVSGSPSSVTVSLAEVNAGTRPGLYQVAFTPDAVGYWSVTVSHASYNAQGWTENYLCEESSTDDLSGLIKELREGNIRVEIIKASLQNLVRNVEVGRLDRMEIETKADGASDWASPTSTKTLYFWYENLGDENPVVKGENG